MTFITLPLSTVAIAGAVLTICYLLYRAALPRPIPGIPYHKASTRSILGDIPAMMKHTSETSQVFDWMVAQCVDLNSPIVQVFIRPFGRPFVVLADFREGQDILMRRVKEFDRSVFMGDLTIGLAPDHHISMPSNEIFKQHRRLLADTMSPAFLNEVAAPHIYAVGLDLLEIWRLRLKLAEGHPWSARSDIYPAALDAIWATAFGSHADATISQRALLSSIDKLDKPQGLDMPVEFPKAPLPAASNAILTLTDSLQITVKSPLPRQHHWILRQFPYMRTAKAYKEGMISERLETAREKFSEASEKDKSINSALEYLLRRELSAARKEGRAPVYDTRAVKDELFGFLIGGHDTVATTITWGVKLLTDYQKVQQKLRQDLRDSFPEAAASGTNPSPAEIVKSQIPYLDATVEEILRCATTAPAQFRDATCDTEILGFPIPKGTSVFCMTNGPSFKSAPLAVDENARHESSRRAKGRTGAWDTTDMSLFVPERWLARGEKGETVFDLMAGPSTPFGLGPRGCFGRKLAKMELRIIFVLLVWTFDFQPTPAHLSSYSAIDRITHQPQQCFVRLALAT